MWHTKEPMEQQVSCSLAKSPDIYIEAIPRQKIEYLLDAYPHREWLGYLVGTIGNKSVFVSELSIPPHREASGASAEAEPFNIPENCVGVIHSHHSMGAFHSGTDQNFVDKNFPVSITVACKGGRQLEFDAVSYIITPCGKASTGKSAVKYVLPKPLFDKDTFLAEAKKNINQGIREFQLSDNWGDNKQLPSPRGNGHKVRVYAQQIPVGADYTVDENGNVLTGKELEKYLEERLGEVDVYHERESK